MEDYERVKYLRKEILFLSQKEFAQRINISRSNLANIETNKVKLTNRVVNDICKEFNISKLWLTQGIEPMDITKEITFEEFAKGNNMTKLEEDIIRTFLSLSPLIREKIIESLRSCFVKEPDNSKKSSNSVINYRDRDDIAEKVADYERQLIMEKNTKTLLASQGLSKKVKKIKKEKNNRLA